MLWVGWLVPGLAQAQGGSDEAKREYDSAIEIGLQEMRLGNYAEAYAAMRRAHGIDPNARTLRAMGIAAFELKRYVASLRHLRESLDTRKKALTPEMRTEVEGLIERVETYIERVQVKLEPEDALLIVDGAAPELDEEGRVLLTLGEHQLRASADGYETASRTLHADGSRERSVTLRLSPIVEHIEAGTSPVTRARERTRDPDPGRAQRTWGFVALGASAVFAGGAAVAYGLRESAAATYNSERCAPMPSMQCPDEASQVDTMETLTIVGLGAAGAMVVTGLILVLTAPDGESDVARDGSGCRLGLGSLHCQARF